MVVTGCQCGGVDVRVRHQCGDVWSGVRASECELVSHRM